VIADVDAVGATLLRAASEVLAEDGPAALTVRRIAHRAGVSTMNVYSRFGGKDGVVEHLFVEGFTRLSTAMSEVTETDDPLDDLRRCGMAYRRFALDNPTYYSIMFERVVADYAPSPAALEVAGGTLQQLADKIELAMQAGAIAAADPFQTAAAIWATCHGVISLEMKEVGPGLVDWAGVYHDATDALMTGLIHGRRRTD
jgi:AcrR family transcriptional regulator